jgi:hypothetical protein
MTSNTSKGSGEFDLNAQFRSVMHELGLAGAVLRNQALLARPGTGRARVKQAGMDNRLRLRATVTDHQES